jgi:hypothetical protein
LCLLWLIPCGVLAAFSAALSIRAEQQKARMRTDECPSCSYTRVGLAADVPCPECGAAAPKADDKPLQLHEGPYPSLILIAATAPILQATLAMDVHFILSIVTWSITVGLIHGWIALIRTNVPIRRAGVLLRASILGLLAGTMMTVAFMILKFAGIVPPAEYGAAFDIAIAGYLAGPLISAGCAGWSFTLVAVAHVIWQSPNSDSAP